MFKIEGILTFDSLSFENGGIIEDSIIGTTNVLTLLGDSSDVRVSGCDTPILGTDAANRLQVFNIMIMDHLVVVVICYLIKQIHYQ